MAKRPQNSPRGNFGKWRLEVGAADGLYFNDYSTSSALIDANSTGLKVAGALYLSGETSDAITQDTTAVLLSAGIALSGQGSANAITQDSTGLLVADGIALSGQASTNAITQDSTALLVPDGIALSGKASTLAITQNSTGLKLPGGLYLSGQTAEPATQNTTGFLFPDQVRVDGSRYIGADSTAYLFTSEATLPTTDGGDYKWTFIVNSTGVGSIAINTTGTTWKYVRLTSTINTT